MTDLTRPRALAPGARLRVVAPSGPVPHERFERGLRVVRRHLGRDVEVAGQVQAQEGFLAGGDRERAAALQAALADTDAGAILCARGGYGATRLLPTLDPGPLRAVPRPLVGFSDVTALLCWAWTQAGVASVHGPVVTQLATLAPQHVERLADLLRGEVPAPLCAEEGTCVHGGRVEGRLLAGNLEVLRSLVGTRFLPPLAGAILAVEEVGERPYRIDRALTQMIQAGVFRGVRGVVVGQLTSCGGSDPSDRPTARDVIVERLQTLGIPVVTGFPFGHDPTEHAALPVGTRVRLDADDCTLTFLEPVTA